MVYHVLSRAKQLARLAPLVCLPLLGACHQLVVLNPAGDVAVQQKNLVLISTFLMLLIIVPVIILTGLFAWRYRQGAEDSTYDPDFDHSTMLELVIWSAPLLIIIALGAITWGSTHLLDPYREVGRIAPGQQVAANVKPLEVDVVALDWKWLFIYPEQGVASINELALPVNRPVHFRISSSSIMNSFYIPALAGQIYAMPGMETTLNAVLNRPGNYNGFSANYSGAGFSDMNFQVHGLSPADFDRWTAATKTATNRLDRATYIKVEQPSERVPVIHFGSIDPAIFNAAVNECVAPGHPCMSQVMMHDQQEAGAIQHVANDSAMPAHGQKPVGALLKKPGEKGAPPNMTVPRAPGVPGNQAPGSQHNRDLSRNDITAPDGTSAIGRA